MRSLPNQNKQKSYRRSVSSGHPKPRYLLMQQCQIGFTFLEFYRHLPTGIHMGIDVAATLNPARLPAADVLHSYLNRFLKSIIANASPAP